MENNTVLDEYGASEIIEDIRLQVHTPQGSDKLFILVEGEDDKKIFIRLFNLDHVELAVAGTCSKVLESITEIAKDEELHQCVIGIKDADFDHIKKIEYPELSSLFLTDTHDAETMMLTESVFERLCFEVISKADNKILLDALSIVVPYSYLRFFNDVNILPYANKRSIKFDGFSMTKNNPSLSILSCSDWATKIMEYGPNKNNPNYPSQLQLEEFVQSNPILSEQYLSFVNGHDMMFVIRDLFHARYPNSKKYSDSQLSSILRSSYSIHDFVKTNLFETINKWAEEHTLDIWRIAE